MPCVASPRRGSSTAAASSRRSGAAHHRTMMPTRTPQPRRAARITVRQHSVARHRGMRVCGAYAAPRQQRGRLLCQGARTALQHGSAAADAKWWRACGAPPLPTAAAAACGAAPPRQHGSRLLQHRRACGARAVARQQHQQPGKHDDTLACSCPVPESARLLQQLTADVAVSPLPLRGRSSHNSIRLCVDSTRKLHSKTERQRGGQDGSSCALLHTPGGAVDPPPPPAGARATPVPSCASRRATLPVSADGAAAARILRRVCLQVVVAGGADYQQSTACSAQRAGALLHPSQR